MDYNGLVAVAGNCVDKLFADLYGVVSRSFVSAGYGKIIVKREMERMKSDSGVIRPCKYLFVATVKAEVFEIFECV